MKKSLSLNLFFIFCATAIFAQDFKPWNVSLSFSGYQRTLIVAPAISRSLGDRFEIGVMPIFHHYKQKPSGTSNYQRSSYGLNVTGRYFMGRGQALEPYVFSIFGYGTSKLLSF